MQNQLKSLIQNALKQKTFPGIEILLAEKGKIIFHEVYGHLNATSPSPPLTKNALFDIASLTKPLVTTLIIMKLVEEKVINLTTKIIDIFPAFKGHHKADITIQHLLTHTSGLPAHIALYEGLPPFPTIYQLFDNKDLYQKIRLQLLQIPLETSPNTRMKYSCLGFLILGEIIRHLTQKTLSINFDQLILQPLGLQRTTFNPDQHQKDLVPTGYCYWRNIFLKGVVNDANAALFGGEGGNAGLFSTAAEIYQICSMLLNYGDYQNQSIFRAETIQKMWQKHTAPSLEPWALGWDYKEQGVNSYSCGQIMSSGAIGHTGFTGTSLWIDPQLDRVVIVLTNRTAMITTNNQQEFRDFRPQLHNQLLKLIN